MTNWRDGYEIDPVYAFLKNLRNADRPAFDAIRVNPTLLTNPETQARYRAFKDTLK